MDILNLGERLRSARERRRISLQFVSEAIGLPQSEVTNIETGKRSVSTLELTRMTELYGQPAAYFLDEPDQEDNISVVLHRAIPEITEQPEINQAIGNIINLCKEGSSLKIMLNQSIDQDVPDYSTRMFHVDKAIYQAQNIAQEERRRLGLDNAPIGNIAKTITDQGIWTASTDLPKGLSGFFVNYPTVGTAILINAGDSAVHRRFSYAHEYAHALFDRKPESVTATRLKNISELVEKRANAFAAAFLMPAEGIAEKLAKFDKRHLSHAEIIFDGNNNVTIEEKIQSRLGSQVITYQDVAVLAKHFGVSYESAIWRLKSLHYVDQDSTETLIQKRKTGNHYIKLLDDHNGVKHEPLPELELRNQLIYLALEAYRQGEISRGRIFEISRKISINPVEMIELAEPPE